MEFVEGMPNFLQTRYDPHPTVFKAQSPHSYNPTGGTKFMPKLTPSTIGSPQVHFPEPFACLTTLARMLLLTLQPRPR